jgi:hypothetical protein
MFKNRKLLILATYWSLRRRRICSLPSHRTRLPEACLLPEGDLIIYANLKPLHLLIWVNQFRAAGR